MKVSGTDKRMADERPGFSISCNAEQDQWYVIHKQMKGNVLHTEILAPRYQTEEDAREAMIALIEDSR